MNSLEYFLKNKDADAPKPNIRFYRDNKQLNGSKLLSDGLAPKVSDKTFNTYIDRIQEKPNAKECSVVLDAPVFSPAFIDNVYGLLRKVYSELGYIAPGSFPFLIYGQYKLTPFGMHNHNSTNECDGTFAVALAGEKNIWVWPPDFEKIHPKSQESHDFDEYAAHATKLTAKPGQMIYLTSYHLHVGEAKKKSDLSLFLAIKPDNDVILELFIYFLSNVKTFVPSHEFTKSQDLATKILDDYVDFVQKIKICERDITRLPFDIKHLQECAQRVPDEIVQAGQPLLMYFSEEVVGMVEQEFWLSTLTSFGLLNPPTEYNKPPLSANQNISLLDNYSVIWSGNQRHIAVSSGGRVWRYNLPLKAVSAMIDHLNRGGSVIVKALIDVATKNLSISERAKFSAKDFKEVLDQLNQTGALRVFD